MQLDTTTFLELVEQTGSLVTFDIESLNLNADYGSMLCMSYKFFGQDVKTIFVDQPGDDKELAIEAKEILESAKCWLSFNGKGFDIKYINSALLYNGEEPIQKRHHVDLYFQLKPKLRTSRKGLGPLAGWLQLEEGKMGVSQAVWREIIDPKKFKQHRSTMIKRCESDVRVLEKMYLRTKKFIGEVTR